MFENDKLFYSFLAILLIIVILFITFNWEKIEAYNKEHPSKKMEIDYSLPVVLPNGRGVIYPFWKEVKEKNK